MAMKFAQLYFTYKDALANLTDEECGRVIKALMVYATEGKQPTFNSRSLEQQTYLMLARQYDSDASSYGKKSSDGARGGRPPRGRSREPETETTENHENHNENGFDRFPHEGKGKEGIGRESSSSKGKDIGAADAATMMTAELVKLFESHIGPATEYIQTGLEAAVQGLGPELAKEILETCIDNGAKQWSYLRAAYAKAKAQGITTVAAYRGGHMRTKGTVVDRPTPSGNDILQRAVRRPLRLKREE